ncbi:MAG: succinate dehydrogenase [Oscillospiraceae bacterium]|nr:succinate dehydrogenase [Oscillospiraceae bacterium]MBQ9168678.1 succinate dehydrogenase [Oscillospiraceae bacterium]
MKVILKILLAPVILILTLFVWLCSALLYCSAFVFGLAGTLGGILALLVLLSGAVQNAVILLVIAFLVSPMGLPMAAAWLLGKVQDLRYAIQDSVYG